MEGEGERPPRIGRLIALVAVFVVIGTPLVAYLWEATNVLLAGHFRPVQLGIAVVALPIFIVVLRALANRIHSVEGDRDALPGALGQPPRDRQ